MSRSPDEQKHFIIKHGLDAFQLLPNYIWRTGRGENEVPHRFKEVHLCDRWIGFAYTTSDNRERSLSLVTGFFECVAEARYDYPPLASDLPASEEKRRAWLIEGKQFGEQPNEPVGVPPIDSLLNRNSFKQSAIVPITGDEFDRIQQYTLSHQLNTKNIPLLGREPKNEQEVLAMVIHAHKQFGIDTIIRVHKAFPDLLVQFEGHSEEVHLELEVYSDGFFLHTHDKQVKDGRFTGDGKPVAVLCWIDNKKTGDKDVTKCVHHVYELQALIREGKKMVW